MLPPEQHVIFDVEEIKAALSKSKPSKACGPEHIAPIIMLKQINDAGIGYFNISTEHFNKMITLLKNL